MESGEQVCMLGLLGVVIVRKRVFSYSPLASETGGTLCKGDSRALAETLHIRTLREPPKPQTVHTRRPRPCKIQTLPSTLIPVL